MKIIIIVSTGRCGTTRITEILSKYLPSSYAAIHQGEISRLCNVLGTFMMKHGQVEWLKKLLFKSLLPKDLDGFVITDPLISLVIPKEYVLSRKVAILHLTRDGKDFGKSFYRFTRTKKKSFIAHNFIPFWQPEVFLFENMIKGEKMMSKYEQVAQKKNNYFQKIYAQNPFYKKLDMNVAFTTNELENFTNTFLKTSITIPLNEFTQKSNQSK